MTAVDVCDYNEEGLFGSCARIEEMRILLAAYPNDKILEYILAPVFLYHYKMQALTSLAMLLELLTCPRISCLLWPTMLFAICGWCIVFDDETSRIVGTVATFLVGFTPFLMLAYVYYLGYESRLRPWRDI